MKGGSLKNTKVRPPIRELIQPLLYGGILTNKSKVIKWLDEIAPLAETCENNFFETKSSEMMSSQLNNDAIG